MARQCPKRSNPLDPQVAAGVGLHAVWWEHWHYAPGAVEPLPVHSHAEYQISLMGAFPGEHFYRGSWHDCPAGGMSVIHPGEAHAPSARRHLPIAATYRMLYLPIGVFARLFLCKGITEPFFPVVVRCLAVQRAFAALHHHLESGAAALAVEDGLQIALATLLQMRKDSPSFSGAPAIRERDAVRRVRTILLDEPGRDFTLSELATVCGLSPTHLSRIFRRDVGIGLAAFQLQARLARARALLLAGVPIARAAADVGFTDQSHLTHAFRRVHGVTPGRYTTRPRKAQENTRRRQTDARNA